MPNTRECVYEEPLELFIFIKMDFYKGMYGRFGLHCFCQHGIHV